MSEKKRKEKNYTVYLLTPYCRYEDVKAATKEEAISKCGVPYELDSNEPIRFVAIEED